MAESNDTITPEEERRAEERAYGEDDGHGIARAEDRYLNHLLGKE